MFCCGRTLTQVHVLSRVKQTKQNPPNLRKAVQMSSAFFFSGPPARLEELIALPLSVVSKALATLGLHPLDTRQTTRVPGPREDSLPPGTACSVRACVQASVCLSGAWEGDHSSRFMIRVLRFWHIFL